MRKLSAQRRRTVVIPAFLAAVIPVMILLSRHAHTPVNDALMGLGVGLSIGMSVMSLVLMRRKSCDDGPSLPK